MKFKDLKLTEKDYCGISLNKDGFYLAIRGKGLYKAVEFERVEPLLPNNIPIIITKKFNNSLRDNKGRFVKRS